MRPLQDVMVLDFTTLLPGPMATLLLAEAGAEVLKIERPGGEDMRHYAPHWGRDSASFALLNRGKKSIALDLKDAADRARLAPLLARADILVEQFRPGVMARLGLGYDSLASINPRMIYCSITGYGQTGPKRDVAGHDLNYIGDAGLLALSTGPAAQPVVPPALTADIAGAAYPAVMNILLAMTERARTGKGRHLDIAMTESVFPFAFWALGEGHATGHWPGNGDRLLSGGTARYRLYPTRDGKIVAAAPIEQRFWLVFCRLIGLEDEYVHEKNAAATVARVTNIIRQRDAADWRARFAGEDCCCSIVQTLQEALDDPHFAARAVFAHRLTNGHGHSMPALPVPIDPAFRAAPETPLSAPALGADNDAYLA